MLISQFACPMERAQGTLEKVCALLSLQINVCIGNSSGFPLGVGVIYQSSKNVFLFSDLRQNTFCTDFVPLLEIGNQC